MSKPPKDQDEYSEEETARRRDAVLKRMLETPPKPRKPSGNSKAKRKPPSRSDGPKAD